MALFGPFITHGSSTPGSTDSTGAGAADGGVFPALLHAKTDSTHTAGCSWADQYPQSQDDIIGCSGCKDEGAVEPYLNCSYSSQPRVHVSQTEEFISFRSLALATDSLDFQRQALARQRATEILAPHTLENPLTFYAAGGLSMAEFKELVDSLAAVGFELIVLDSNTVQMDGGPNLNTTFMDTVKIRADYARSKGLEVGAYVFMLPDMYRNPAGASVPLPAEMANAGHGGACMASTYYEYITQAIDSFCNYTGITMLDTDGPYGGQPCTSTNHSHHHDAADSVYNQAKYQSRFYGQLVGRGFYLHVPDNYFFAGSR